MQNLNNEIYHSGVKGMKWGVRRYQNKDGSYTDLGKRRLGIVIGNNKPKQKLSKEDAKELLNKHYEARKARSERNEERAARNNELTKAKYARDISKQNIKTQYEVSKMQNKSKLKTAPENYKLERQREKTKQAQAKAELARIKQQGKLSKSAERTALVKARIERETARQNAKAAKQNAKIQKLNAKAAQQKAKKDSYREKAEQDAIKAQQKYEAVSEKERQEAIRRGKVLAGVAVAGGLAVALMGKDQAKSVAVKTINDTRKKFAFDDVAGRTSKGDKAKRLIGAGLAAATVSKALGVDKSIKYAKQKSAAKSQYNKAQAVLNAGNSNGNNQNGNFGGNGGNNLSNFAKVAGLTAAGLGTGAAGYKAYKKYQANKVATKQLSSWSDDDLKNNIDRLNREKQYRDLNAGDISSGQSKTEQILSTAGTTATLVSTIANIASTAQQMRRNRY